MSTVTELPPVVDATWVADRLGEDGLLLADVRGPNAHIRGHLPGSIPLVLGSPAPVTDQAVLSFTKIRLNGDLWNGTRGDTATGMPPTTPRS